MIRLVVLLQLTDTAFAQRNRLFCWIPVLMAFGIGLYFSLGSDPSPGVLIVFTAGLLVTGIAALWWRNYWRFILWAPALIAAGFLVAHARSLQVSAPKIGWHYYGPIEGTISHIDRSTSDKPRILLRDPFLAGASPEETPRKLRISLHSKVKGTELRPGLRVMTTAHLSPPAGPVEPGGFDFQRKAWFQTLGAIGYTKAPVLMAGPSQNDSFALKLFDLRMRISRFTQTKISGQPGAFAAAILTGDRSEIEPQKLQQLRQSNLAHLLAISGLHMGLLTGFVFALVRYALALWPWIALRIQTKKTAAVVALFAGFIYLLLSGANVATQRAFVMVAVMIVAVLIDRPAITLRAVALAAILILLVQPESLLEPGFQMSFAATASLVATFEYLNRNPIYRFQAGLIGTSAKWFLTLTVSSAVAGAATAPISAFHFNQISQFGLLANLASVPVMGSVVMPAAVLAGLLSIAGFSGPAFEVMGWGVQWILNVAAWVSSFDNATRAVPSAPVHALAVLAFGSLCLILLVGRLRFVGVPLVLAAGVLWSSEQRPKILIADNGRLVGILVDGTRQLTRAKGSGFAARSWLENDGDKGDQTDAAARFNGSRDAWVHQIEMQVPGGENALIAYRWDKKLAPTDLLTLCNSVDVLITPNWDKPASGSCILIGKSALRRGGAHMIDVNTGGLFIQSTRDVSGDRVWNR